jgi:ATP-binding cassette subfamily B protein
MLTAWIGQRVMSDLRLELFTHLQGLSISYFDRNPVGRLMTRITSDVETLNELFSSGLVTVFGDVFTLIAIMTMMLVVDWRLALGSLRSHPAHAARSPRFSAAACERRSSDIRIRVARINRLPAGASLGNAGGAVVRPGRGHRAPVRRHQQGSPLAHLRSITVYALFFPAVEFLGSVALGALLWYGGLRVLDQTLTVGILAAFIQLTRRFFQPLQDLAEKYNLLQSAMASSERIFRLMDTQPTVLEPAHPKRLARPIRGEVVFEDVWFRYGGDSVPSSEFRDQSKPEHSELGTRNSALSTENWVLKGVSFTARPDQTLAIVGHTGAGKTTIISLLLRFYDPQRGRITLDGVDLRELPLAQVRELVGFVQQDLFLFTGDILHNLTLDAPISPSGRMRLLPEWGQTGSSTACQTPTLTSWASEAGT